ncbi:fructosamine kinase family protein [Aquimarina sediminis]|uniref:fructosamine kinase family protein n=1 Tax=Aquimarina sediminis TaxID=2070536 RepID=UPI000CA082AD|nr:fructosamine kinase family protein [Aquimarina sediminis]
MMLSKKLLFHLEELLSESIVSSVPLSGGDINEVYLLQTHQRKLVVKLNSISKFPGMFEAEAKGLQILKKTTTFTVPEIILVGAFYDTAFLILEYIASDHKSDDFWSVFGKKLAMLHQNSSSIFGFEKDNYIGSLPQYNSTCDSAYEFYITQRLQPQFRLAKQNGFTFSDLDTFYQVIQNEIPEEKPSLIHGDLWSGNYMIDKNGFPCLIDPAVAYAPREMDIGMMHLFGGFDSTLFQVYNENFPLADNWKERLPIWQLYYLLVHLNLFGSSYYNRVKEIVESYK